MDKIKLKFSSFWASPKENNERVIRNWGSLPECFELSSSEDYDYLIVLTHSPEMENSPPEKNIAFCMEPSWSPNVVPWRDKLIEKCKYIITNDEELEWEGRKGKRVVYGYNFMFHHDSRKNHETNFQTGPSVEQYLSEDTLPEGVDNEDYPLKACYINTNHGIPNLGYPTGTHPRWETLYDVRDKLFTDILESDLPIDLYGNNWNTKDPRYKGSPYLKREAIKGYKYCIAIENSRSNLYISEKFFDPILNNTVPIYYGCKTINQAYDPESYVEFNPQKDSAIEQLRYIIEQPISQRNAAIQKSKKDYFIKYNLLNFLEDLLNTPTVIL